MNQRDFIDLVSGARTGALATLQRGVLRGASWAYGAVVQARLWAYASGARARYKAAVPVICVGNLTTGGTGKTPAVAWVVNALSRQGRKPAIVSRGYRADESGNDEQRVLEELCPGVPHLQDPDRARGVAEVVRRGADVVVLDDGFSHLRLARELDILLFDALNPFGWGRVLPRGLLREPLRSVRRAQFAVFTRADVATPERLRDLEDSIRCHGFTGGIAHAAHRPTRLVEIGSTLVLSPADMQGKVVAPFCGIGNPTGFQRTLEALGATLSPVGLLRLDDHAAVAGPDWERQVLPFLKASQEQGATHAVCTQKDAVKLRLNPPESPLPLFELRVKFELLTGEEDLRSAITAALES